MTKIYVVILPLLIFLCFSCKKELPSPSFELSANPENNSVVLSWPPIFMSGFKSINVYRSVSPIPDPLFNKQLDGNLLIGTITDKTINTFKDSSVVLGASGTVYYKIVMNLADRVIPSNEVQTSLDGFSIIYNSSGFGGNTSITAFPENNILYLINSSSGTISVIDYSQKKIIKSVFMSQGIGTVYPVINAGNPELFIMNGNNLVSCYNALTLVAKYNISIANGTIRDFEVKDNYMYVLYMASYYTAKIRTYDLTTQLMVGEKTVYSKVNNGPSNPSLFIGTQTNKLFFKYYSGSYNSQGNYVYTNKCVNYNIVNFLPADSVVIANSLLNPDTINGSAYNFYQIQPSPDGKYLTCNANGDILSLVDNSLHNVNAGNNFNPLIVYSNTGNYLLGKPNFNGGMSSNLIEVFSLPNFNLVTSIKSPNPSFNQGSSSMIKDDFLDNDTLVSYNLKHTFLNNQTKSVLTVFFKKIN